MITIDRTYLKQNFEHISEFIKVLTGHENNPVLWCFIHDWKEAPKRLPTIHQFGSVLTMKEKIIRYQSMGYGVFVTINENDGTNKRSADHIKSTRALFVECDTGFPEKKIAIPSSMVIQTRKGVHIYWKLKSEDQGSLDRFTKSQKQMIKYYDTDPAIHDWGRVMRVPGTWHQKDPDNPFLVKLLSWTYSLEYSIDELLEKHPVVWDEPEYRPFERIDLTRFRAGNAFKMFYNWTMSHSMIEGGRNVTLTSICAEGWGRVNHGLITQPEMERVIWEWGQRAGLKNREIQMCFKGTEKVNIARPYQPRLPEFKSKSEPKPVNEDDFLSLGQARREVKKILEELVINHQDHKGECHVISVTTGAGKTKTMIDVVNSMVEVKKDNAGNEFIDWSGWIKRPSGKQARILWLVDNYKLLEETRMQFHFSAEVIKGRSDKEGSLFYCLDSQSCLKAGASGHNIVKSVCSYCPLFNPSNPKWGDCRYWETVASIMEESPFVISTKHSFLNQSQRIEQFDIVVVDEALPNHLFNCRVIELKDIQDHFRMFHQKKKQNPDIDFDHPHWVQLKKINEEVRMSMMNFGESKHLDWDFVTSTVPYDEDTPLPVTGESGDTFWIYPKKFLSDLAESSVFVKGGKLYVYTPLYELINRLNNRLVINLDATPLPSLLQCVEAEIHDIQVKQNIKVFQCQSVKGSRRQLNDVEYKVKYIRAIKALSDQKKSVVFSVKSFINEAIENGDISADSGVYGSDTRGTNRFMEYDRFIYAGDFCHNLDHCKMLVKASEKLGQEITLDRLIQESAQAEILQGIGRARAVNRPKSNPAEIWLLTNRVVEGLPVHVQVKNLESIYGEEYERDIRNKERSQKAVSEVQRFVRWQTTHKGRKLSDLTVEEVHRGTGVSRQVIRRTLESLKIYEANQIPANYQAMELAYSNNTDHFVSGGTSFTLSNLETTDIPGVIKFLKHHTTFLFDRVPEGVHQIKWNRFVKALETDPQSISDLSRTSKLGRPVCSKYLSIAIEAVQKHEEWNYQINQRLRGEYKDPETYFVKWFEDQFRESPESLMKLISGHEDPMESLLVTYSNILTQSGQVYVKAIRFIKELHELSRYVHPI